MLAPNRVGVPLTDFHCSVTDTREELSTIPPQYPVSHNHRLRHDLEQSENIIGFITPRGIQECLTCYNKRMKNTNSNGTTKTATSTKSRKGPRPIMTIAMLREKLLKEMLVKELRKIDNKYGKLLRRLQMSQDKVYNMERQLDNLAAMRTEYAAEVNA